MRFWTLVFCTLLSLPGFFGPLLVSGIGLSQAVSCLLAAERPDCLFEAAGAVGYGLVCVAAWSVYFRMGCAWVNRAVVAPGWPVLGLVLGLCAMNFGGAAGSWAPYAGVLVLPALFLALWMSGYHLKRWRQAGA